MSRNPLETPGSDADEQLIEDVRTGNALDPTDPAARAIAQLRDDVNAAPIPPLDFDQILGKP